jgi:hypothetical protein
MDQTDEAAPLDLTTLTLAKGAHRSPECGMCIEEARTVWHGWAWGDSPEYDSPVIAAFLRSWNDALGDEDRQQLVRYVTIPPTVATPEVDETRAWMATDWLIRTYTPAWLRLAGLAEQADRLAGLAEVRAGMDVPAIRPVIDAVRSDAVAAWVAAGDAAGDAALVAARDAAWVAAGIAARVAAGVAAWDAAWDAARDAAGDAARVALRPTVVEIQASAHDLIARMISVTA